MPKVNYLPRRKKAQKIARGEAISSGPYAGLKRSDAIRRIVGENPSVTNAGVVAELAKDGAKVSGPYVSTVRSTDAAKIANGHKNGRENGNGHAKNGNGHKNGNGNGHTDHTVEGNWHQGSILNVTDEEKLLLSAAALLRRAGSKEAAIRALGVVCSINSTLTQADPRTN